MEMAQLIRLSLALLCCSVVVLSTETGENNYNDVVQFVLNWYNGNSDSQRVYNSAKLLNAYKKNDSVPLYLLQLEVVTSCNRSQNCQSSSLICEVGVRENLQSHTKEVLTDRAKCAKKEIEPVIPSFGHGFSEENITDEIRSIAAFAIQQSQNNGANKRSVIDIMSVKRQVVGNATTLYLTLKVTKNEGGDAVQFEICEAEVNQTGEMAWESSLSCFPLNGLSSETPINAEDITTVAERAADEMDSLSYSEFTLKLKDVLKAETTVTPGSEGTMTNLELRLLPTVCLKNVDVENDAYGLNSNRLCSENSNKRLRCSVISWDRPWVDDTLYSEPSCRVETQVAVSNQSTNAAIQNVSPDVMMNDGMEPENEEVLIPAVEHHSIPVVEELDPIIEQILPDIEKPVAPEVEEPLIPVVEEPIIAKHVYCTGCPIDLNVNNPALDEFVEQALASIDESSNGQNMYRATRITKAQKQVVNGVKYILQLEVAETICRKDSGQNRGTCETSNNEIRTCIVEFLEKPWIDSSRVIVSNNCTRYDNDLENEIKPHFISHSHLARQEIFDYLDEMEEPKPIPNSEDFPSYGKDSLYPPESEPTNHPVENDAEEIEIKTTTDEHRKSEKAVMESSDSDMKTDSPVESEESKESEENQTEKRTAETNSGESVESSEESRENENQEEKIDKIAAYITNENRNRRETSLTPNFGALKEVTDSEKELVDKLAQIAVNTLDEIDEDDKKRVVLEILSAHKQIVNGIMYHLLLRIVSTSCSELGQSDPSCVNEQLSPIRICKVELHRSFTSNSQLDAKVVKSECTIENQNATEKKLRRKRDVSVVSGGIYTANTSDPYILRMADFAVTELDKGTNSLYRQCIVSIGNASKQVVAGYNIHLTLTLSDSVHRKGENITDGCQQDANSETRECHVTIWDRPWIENSQRVTSFNCTDNEGRSKRDTSERHHRTLIGGPIDADTNDTYIQELAGTALEEVDRRSNAIFKQQIVRIIEAKKQVVAGVKVRLTMEVGYTNCRKGRQENQECQLNENSNNQICYVEIWDRPWLSDRRITNFSCNPANVPATSASTTTEAELVVNRKKRDTLGGHSSANTSDPYIQEVASSALLEVDRRSNALHKQQIVRIISATKQVVAGLKIHLVMELGYTTCRKGRNVTENCQLRENSNNQICHIQVWDRPWLQDRRVTNISCSPAADATITTTITEPSDELQSSNRLKRHVGGFSKLEVDDPYALEMAKTALDEYDKKSNALFKQKIIRIIEAQRQVVAGTLTRLTIEIGYSKCRKGHEVDVDTCELRENSKNQICNVELWDRPWLKKREIKKSSCSPSLPTRSKRKSLKNDFHIEAFQNFIEKYNKKYSSNVEFKHRFHIFQANLKKIDLLQRTEQGTATYGITQFADLSKKEFKKYHLGLNPDLKETNEIPMQNAVIPDVELPKEFDWRHYNAVTEVKNQGSCGSCWAFSVTGNIEGQWKINKGQLVSLSEQELVDCDKLDDGCNGGLPENAYKAIEKLGGLETEGDYPYEGDDEKCHFKKSDVKVTIQGSVNITKNETNMAQWLYKNGPMSIGINANAMQFYMGGVSHPWKFLCNGDNLDHGVLIVGYGVHKTSILHKTLPYWTIKNSWGKRWGEQGYYRVYRGDGTCGVNQMVTSAIVG